MILPTTEHGGQLRQRRQVRTENLVEGVGAIVQEFDAFLKVADDVKEEPNVAKGICKGVVII